MTVKPTNDTTNAIEAEVVSGGAIERYHPSPQPIIAEIEQQLARTERLTAALEKIRVNCVRATVPSDWQRFGDQLYLEGDGALRIAPLIGLQIANVRKDREVKDNGHIRVTVTADCASLLFGTQLAAISKSRATDDDFMTKGKDAPADVYEVEAAAYKGMIGRAVQLLAGLSGIKPEEMKQRFGFDYQGSAVQFKTANADAKKADSAAAVGGQAEAARILFKIAMGDTKKAGDILEQMTKNDAKGWAGKRDATKLTEKGVEFVLSKLHKMEADFDADIAKNEGGAE